MSATCPACLATSTRHAFTAAGVDYLRCRACATLFDPQPPAAQDLAARYDGRDYFVKDGPATQQWGYGGDYLADRPFAEAKFDQLLQHLERYVPVGRLLDVGAGPGFLVSAAAARGWEAVGLDVNPWAVDHARDELGVDVRVGTLEAGAFAAEHFDAVTMMDVLEHVPDPDELLAQAAHLVEPGGVLVLLTPDAGALASRAMGRRWPEVQRPGEHIVLFSRVGLTAALARHGFVSSGWHSTGKTATVATLIQDMRAAAPALAARVKALVERSTIGARVVDLDPRTKFVMYARRAPAGATVTDHRPARIPKRPARLAGVDDAILEELEQLGSARRYTEWLYSAFAAFVPGAKVLEVGAGIGTFTERMLADGAEEVLALEPDSRCAGELERRFSGDARVTVTRDPLPGAPRLREGEATFDLAVCQNVLEHIGDDAGALADMARCLRPGGRLALVVPAGPRLFGGLDDAYGHWRRYDPATLRRAVQAAGLEVESLRHVNLPGMLAWWAKNRRPGARVGAGALRATEAVVAAWRPVEERLSPSAGLTLTCVARR